MSYLDEWDKKRTVEVKSAGLFVGDFVSLVGEFGDVWHEVKTVFDNSFMSYDSHSRTDTRYTYFDRINKIHRKDDPWNHFEVGVMDCKDGRFSKWSGHKYGAPLLDRHKYKGNFTLEPWLWYYCGRNCMPKTVKDVVPHFQTVGLNVDSQIAWNEVEAISERIRSTSIKGWSLATRLKPVTTYNKTISIIA